MIELICTILLSIVALIAGWGQCVKDNRPTALGGVIFCAVLVLTSVGASSVYLGGKSESRKRIEMMTTLCLVQNEIEDINRIDYRTRAIDYQAGILASSLRMYFGAIGIINPLDEVIAENEPDVINGYEKLLSIAFEGLDQSTINYGRFPTTESYVSKLQALAFFLDCETHTCSPSGKVGEITHDSRSSFINDVLSSLDVIVLNIKDEALRNRPQQSKIDELLLPYTDC